MNPHFKKILSYTTSIALLTSSLSPVYAGKDHNKVDEDLSVEARHRPALLFSEDALREKAKAHASGHTGASGFVRDIASQAYQRVSSWFGQDEDPFFHELGFLKADDRESFAEEIEDMKTSAPDRRRLKSLQDMVWERALSPHTYEKGLRELDPYDSEGILEGVRTKFQKKLTSAPASLNGAFQKDLLVFINHPCVRDTSAGDISHTLQSIEEFEDLLSYYRGIQNPLDYTETLVGLNRILQKDKSLNLTDQQSRDLKKTISIAATAAKKKDPEQYRTLKAQQRFIKAAFQELPFNGEDVSEDVFNSSLSTSAKEEAIQGDDLSDPLSVTTAFKGLTHAAYKGAKYAIEHPFQALTIALASQVTVSAARGFVGPEFPINQNTTYNQFAPSVASLTNGNAFVAWQGAQAINDDIYGRLFFPNGTALPNGEFRINQNTTANHFFPSIAGLANGNAFVAWHGDQTGDFDVYARLFAANGTGFPSEFRINTVTSGQQTNPSVAGLQNGNAFVAWQGDYDIYGRLFAANGTALPNGEFRINTNTTIFPGSPSVASLTNGNVFVAWVGAQAGDYDIYGRIFSPNGTGFPSEFPINQNTTLAQLNPSVASLMNGNVFVTWEGSQTGWNDIYGRIFSANGVPLTNEFGINTVTLSAQRPSVAGLQNGNAFVAWDGDTDVYGHIFAANGTGFPSEFRIDTATSGQQFGPSVASLPNGNVFIAWTGNQAGNNDIYGRIYTAPSQTTSTTANPTTGSPSTNAPTSMTSSPSMSATRPNTAESSSHRLTPSWFLSPVQILASFNRLWNMAKGVK
ncbi:MAG: hypothetical protein ACD_16C00240G0002 [uncultured bacterium]|nr:MAG: hypothetical protein ACD_16C00240G0002 [uncultured bacterium]HBG35164.1 hypothetical protein [Holosporales bacterium]